jgi:hypothetical protein
VDEVTADEPVFQALLLAEYVWNSPMTGQASISNLFESILLHPDYPIDKPPPPTKPFRVFAKIAGLQKDDIVKIRIYSDDLGYSCEIGAFSVEEDPTPYRAPEFSATISPLELPKMGLYHVEVTARNNPMSVPLFIGPFKPDEE